jgi:hypothetical protein
MAIEIMVTEEISKEKGTIREEGYNLENIIIQRLCCFTKIRKNKTLHGVE